MSGNSKAKVIVFRDYPLDQVWYCVRRLNAGRPEGGPWLDVTPHLDADGRQVGWAAVECRGAPPAGPADTSFVTDVRLEADGSGGYRLVVERGGVRPDLGSDLTCPT